METYFLIGTIVAAAMWILGIKYDNLTKVFKGHNWAEIILASIIGTTIAITFWPIAGAKEIKDRYKQYKRKEGIKSVYIKA